MEKNNNVIEDNQINNSNDGSRSSEIRKPDKISEPDQVPSNNSREIVISADKVTDVVSDFAKVYGVYTDARAREYISNNDLKIAEIENNRKAKEIEARREQNNNDLQKRREELALEEKKIQNETEIKRLDIVTHGEIEKTKINTNAEWERKMITLEAVLDKKELKISTQNIEIEQLKKELDSVKIDLEKKSKKIKKLKNLNQQSNLHHVSQVPGNNITAYNSSMYTQGNSSHPIPHNFYSIQNPSIQPTHLIQHFPTGQYMPIQSSLNITPQYNHQPNIYSQAPQQILPNNNGNSLTTQLSSNRHQHFAPTNNFTEQHSNNIDTSEEGLKVNTAVNKHY